MDFFAIESLLLFVGLIVLFRYFLHRKWQYFAERNIPTDKPSILTLGTIAGATEQKIFHIDLESKQRLGPVFGIYAGWNPVMIICDPDIMRQIYTKQFKNFPDRMDIFVTLNGKYMNHGLNVVTGDKWMRMRSALSPMFAMSKLKQVFAIADECVTQTIAVIQKKREVDEGKFTPRIVFTNLTLDVIVLTVLGTKVNAQVLEGQETLMSREAFKGGFFIRVVGISLFMFPFLEPIYEKLGITVFPKQSMDYLSKLTREAIEKRVKTGQRETKDVLQMLLDAEVQDEEIAKNSTKGLTRDEIVGNAMLMMGAGFENIANSMVFLAYNLAFHPDVQEKLQQEVDGVVAEKGGFDYEAIGAMKYLEMCVNESMRLYNPILRNGRICRKETTINGLTIPKGMTVNFPVFALSHDPEYWEDPWEFKPERMEDMSQIDPMVFQTFGAGPRNCVGPLFALMKIKITFFKLMQNFTFEPCEDTPKPPLKLRAFLVGISPLEQFRLRAIPRKSK